MSRKAKGDTSTPTDEQFLEYVPRPTLGPAWGELLRQQPELWSLVFVVTLVVLTIWRPCASAGCGV